MYFLFLAISLRLFITFVDEIDVFLQHKRNGRISCVKNMVGWPGHRCPQLLGEMKIGACEKVCGCIGILPTLVKSSATVHNALTCLHLGR